MSKKKEKKEFYGILELDHPTLTPAQSRAIQLGESIKLPDGSSVQEYVSKVEAMKEANLKREGEKRDEDLRNLASAEPISEETPEEEDEEYLEFLDEDEVNALTNVENAEDSIV